MKKVWEVIKKIFIWLGVIFSSIFVVLFCRDCRIKSDNDTFEKEDNTDEINRKAAAKREKRVQQKKEVTAHIEPSESAQMATTPEKATTVLDEIDAAYDNYSINMTSEEAQKEFVDAFILRVLSEKKLWKIAHANIVDPAGNITDGRAMIDKLSSPLMLENINTILKNNPALLETWQTIALEDILGRELIVDSCYVPIEGQALRKNLMSLSV